MRRYTLLWISTVVGLAVAGLGTGAGQNEASAVEQHEEDLEATISALQTEVAGLKTQVASQDFERTSTPDPDPELGTVLYEADWTGGIGDWKGGLDWDTVNGTLVNDGSNGNPGAWIVAPFGPGRIANSAVEAEMRVGSIPGGGMGFGLVARAEPEGAYRAGYWQGNDFKQNMELYVSDCGADTCSYAGGENKDGQQYPMDTAWHTYRLEVEDTSVRFLLDGRLVAEITDTQFQDGGRVGIFALANAKLSVRNFKVIAL